MNPYIDEDLQALGEHVRRFAAAKIAPGFQERDQARVLDRVLMAEMGEMGFIAPELPEELGGQGMGCLAAGVIHEEVARVDLSISYINLLASLNAQILSHHGQPEFGAAVPPMTLEAEVLHYADNSSAKSASMADALEDDENFSGDELVSSRGIWQLDRRRAWRGKSDWGSADDVEGVG